MKVEKHWWHSPSLGIPMPVAVYGHWGTPLLFFPTASADFEELERFGMIDALAHHIEAGRVKIVSCNAINDLSWFDYGLHPGERVWRQELYDRYLVRELVPFIWNNCGGRVPIGTVGASMGAYHAMNAFGRHPGIFRSTITMSGFYNISRYHQGEWNELCYFHNPTCYLANAWHSPDKWLLDSASINVICGQGPWERVEFATQMHEVLNAGGIPHTFDLWGHDVSHDWPWWKKQMNHYIWKLYS